MAKGDLGDMVWEDPGPPLWTRGRYDWQGITKHLHENPGQWMRIFEGGPVSIANAIRQGDVRALRPEDGYEVTTRHNVRYPHRRCDLYLRWVPKDDE